MQSTKKFTRRKHRGVVLIISMIFVLVFSVLAVSMASLSDTNVQLADNQHKVNVALSAAQSGQEITRFWLNRVSISGTTAPSQIFTQIASSLQNDLASSGIYNIVVNYDGSSMTIPSVTLDSTNGQSFAAVIRPLDPETIQVDITGVYGTITRTIRVNYKFAIRADTVFNFGVATKGPLHLAGNIELEGATVAVEASVYIESENADVALSITGNSQIAGDVSVTNPLATVELQGGQASIGGETGQAAIDNHVSFGDLPPEFPVPNPGYFEHYVINTIDSSTNTTADATFENVRIVAGTNPTFSGHVTLKGVVFIETPNVVTFTGNSTVTGIIIGDGDFEDDSGINQINFLGDVESFPVTELPSEEQFAGLENETGTFVLAPGFSLSFGGSFATLNGAIAGNGIEFFGGAGGTINGSVINYSGEEMLLTGNSDLYFNRSGATQMPAGFVPEIILQYEPASYSEIVL